MASVLGVAALAGLRYMHGAGLIHNDVKPGNVLIKSGQALLADCGTAVAQRWQRQCDSEVTLPYRAPELLLGLEERTAKSDVWSAGLVLAEMGRGSRVFSEDSQVVARLKLVALSVSNRLRNTRWSLLKSLVMSHLHLTRKSEPGSVDFCCWVVWVGRRLFLRFFVRFDDHCSPPGLSSNPCLRA